MPKYKVWTSEVRMDLYEVEAESKEEAVERVVDGAIDPIDVNYDNFQVDQVEEVKSEQV